MDPPLEQIERHVDRCEEEQDEHGHLHHGRRLLRTQPHRDSGCPERPGDVQKEAQSVKTEEIDPVAADLHARDQRDDGHDRDRDEPPDGRGGCVAEDDSASPRCRQQKAAHEAALEVARNAKAGKDPREGGRLQQHENELECGIAGAKVESWHVANS